MADLWFTAEGIRKVDRLATDDYHIPSIVLMENAAVALRAEALAMMAANGLASAVVLAGPGNNGGDGFALARHLANEGCHIQIVHTSPGNRYRGDAAINFRIAEAMRLPMRLFEEHGEPQQCWKDSTEPILFIDALLGTGLARPASGPIAAIIHALNHRPATSRVLAVDIPSGMDADRGPVLGPCVRADVTVTFVGWKIGMRTPEAQKFIGRVVVGSIGAPSALAQACACRAPC